MEVGGIGERVDAAGIRKEEGMECSCRMKSVEKEET